MENVEAMAVVCLHLTRWSLETCHLVAVPVTFPDPGELLLSKERGEGIQFLSYYYYGPWSDVCPSQWLQALAYLRRGRTHLHSSRRTVKTFFLLYQSGSSWLLMSLVCESAICPWPCVILLSGILMHSSGAQCLFRGGRNMLLWFSPFLMVCVAL